MNSRQKELLSSLKEEFERMNSRTNVGATLIDLKAIVQDIDDSKQIRVEIELQNKILRKELYGEFVSKLKQVQKELATIGIISELRDDEHPHLHIGRHPHHNFFVDAAFFISTFEDNEGINLPDDTCVYKFTKLQIHIKHGVYFDSVDELVKSEDFIYKIKKLAR